MKFRKLTLHPFVYLQRIWHIAGLLTVPGKEFSRNKVFLEKQFELQLQTNQEGFLSQFWPKTWRHFDTDHFGLYDEAILSDWPKFANWRQIRIQIKITFIFQV